MDENSGSISVGVACGGTGGHMFPGMATARELKRRGHDVTLWVAERDIEDSGLVGWDGSVNRIASRGLGAKNPFALLRTLFVWGAAIVRCRKKMSAKRPDVLLAMGSYTSVGPVVAAWSLRIPVVLHEANAVPGRAVSMLSRMARSIATTFPVAESALPAAKCVRTGLPLRRELGPELSSPENDARFTVLVMGGSLGAHRLNEVTVEAICSMDKGGESPLRVIHLSGAADEEWVRSSYKTAGVTAEVYGFCHDMLRAYADADIAVCRAGASSCMELCACRLPSLLIPLPHAVRDHQTANARIMADSGAAELLPQDRATPDAVEAFIAGKRNSPDELMRMKAALAEMAMPEADSALADLVLSATKL